MAREINPPLAETAGAWPSQAPHLFHSAVAAAVSPVPYFQRRLHKQAAIAGQSGNNVFGHTIGEKFLVFVLRHIDEGQHRDGEFIGNQRRWGVEKTLSNSWVWFNTL
ncbi:MAG: hypothetical protein KBT89_05050 [Gammaproteobacteria bacterium]|nr:hypothetical protein [Gammaproteobacteria bacterium]